MEHSIGCVFCSGSLFCDVLTEPHQNRCGLRAGSRSCGSEIVHPVVLRITLNEPHSICPRHSRAGIVRNRVGIREAREISRVRHVFSQHRFRKSLEEGCQLFAGNRGIRIEIRRAPAARNAVLLRPGDCVPVPILRQVGEAGGAFRCGAARLPPEVTIMARVVAPFGSKRPSPTPAIRPCSTQ